MDKFEESIRQAQQIHQPNTNFVEKTMDEITAQQPKKRWNIKIWAPATAGVLAAVVLLFIALPFGNHNAVNAKKDINQTAGTTNEQASGSQSNSVPAGTDNATLADSLRGINGAMNQESADQNNATASLNDSSQQVTVPTD